MKHLDEMYNWIESLRIKIKINPYAFAFLVLIMGSLLEFLFNVYIKQTTYLLFVISIFISAWYGGLFPTMLMTIVGFFIVDYFFIEPTHTFFVSYVEYIRGAIFLVEGFIFGIVGESRKRAEQQIQTSLIAEKKAHKKAEEATQLRDDFLAMVSHELKTPITSQKMYLHYLEKILDKTDNKEAQQCLQKINSQTDRIVDYINNLLNVSKIRAEQFSMNNAIFKFIDSVTEATNLIQEVTHTHKIIIAGTTEKFVYGDKERIHQVFVNLLSNAIKYSPNAKQVLLSIKEDKRNILVSIKDYGIGISTPDQKRLFTRYFRVAGKNEKQYKGSGMGLFIVHEIIKQHKGKIWVNSKQGEGSTFTFTIPIYTKSLG